jgi:hypothetical protein
MFGNRCHSGNADKSLFFQKILQFAERVFVGAVSVYTEQDCSGTVCADGAETVGG